MVHGYCSQIPDAIEKHRKRRKTIGLSGMTIEITQESPKQKNPINRTSVIDVTEVREHRELSSNRTAKTCLFHHGSLNEKTEHQEVISEITKSLHQHDYVHARYAEDVEHEQRWNKFLSHTLGPYLNTFQVKLFGSSSCAKLTKDSESTIM